MTKDKMRQFTVPQFIDVEDKIIGPVTVRQFVIMIVCGLILFLEYKLSDFAFFLFVGVPTALVFLVLAFIKINGMPFHYFILNVVLTFKRPILRIWQRQFQMESGKRKKEDEIHVAAAPVTSRRPINRSHLSELTLLIDTGGVYQGEAREQDASFKI